MSESEMRSIEHMAKCAEAEKIAGLRRAFDELEDLHGDDPDTMDMVTNGRSNLADLVESLKKLDEELRTGEIELRSLQENSPFPNVPEPIMCEPAPDKYSFWTRLFCKK